jgi:hypothetical protein
MISQRRPGHTHFLCEVNMLLRIEGIVSVPCWIYLGKNILRKVWRYQRGDHNPYIAEELTTEWSKQNGTKEQSLIPRDVV